MRAACSVSRLPDGTPQYRTGEPFWRGGPGPKGRGRSLGSALWWFGMTTLKQMAYAILFSVTAVAVAQYVIWVLNGAGG
jgi:hypothetical protein